MRFSVIVGVAAQHFKPRGCDGNGESEGERYIAGIRFQHRGREDFNFIGQGPQGSQEAGTLNDDTYIGFFDHM